MPTPEINNVLSEKEAAKYICMSPSFLRQGRMNGRMEGRTPPPPHLKIGRSIRFLKSDLDNWLLQFRQGEISGLQPPNNTGIG